MKQVAQRLRDGSIEILDVPAPAVTREGVLVDVRASLLSAGTERTKVETGRKSLVGMARSRPDQVRQVVDKARREGVKATLDAVGARLDQRSELGYSAAGFVTAVGSRARGIAPGDRVACGGGGRAVHADVDSVPANLCATMPDNVSFEEAAFATVGAIALHGVRQAAAQLGERVAVVGLGLVGQLTCRILNAAGCTVVGIDLDPGLVDRTAASGVVESAVVRSELSGSLPRGFTGCDAVIVTAATPSADPLELAPSLCRDRARVVVVGDVGMNLPRQPYYDKEMDVRLSRSYGPGRYDREYEERGLDYPIGYVRWTERRNMESFLELIAGGRIEVAGLITDRVPIEEATRAYDRLLASDASALGIVLTYGPSEPEQPTPPPPRSAPRTPESAVTAGVIGAGSFAQRILIPGLTAAGFTLAAVASGRGLSARSAVDRLGFGRADSTEGVLGDPSIGLVVVATRHSTHAELASRALRAGKHAFVEKPPALDERELDELRSARDESGCILGVGFNRRWAPLALALREHVEASPHPVELIYRISAGRLADDHWLNDLDEGGGRLLGEGCHFVDFACWLVGERPLLVSCSLAPDPSRPLAASQTFVVSLAFPGGSLATIAYVAGGAAALPKERVEVHSGGRSAILDDFRSLVLWEGRRNWTAPGRGRDKGHAGQLEALRGTLARGEPLPDLDPLDSMAVTIAALRAGLSGRAMRPGSHGSEQEVAP